MMATMTGPLMSAYVNRLLARAGSDDDSPLGLVDGTVRMSGLTGTFDLRDDDGNVLEVTVRPRADIEPDPSPLGLAREHFLGILAIGRAQAEDPTRARAMGLGQAGRNSAELAGYMAQVSIAEDVRRLADFLTAGPPQPERITRPDGDWLLCICGNEPSMSGFASCLPDGTPVEPVGGSGPGAWGGRLYVCLDCGRIVDQETLDVIGRRGEPYIRALEARVTDLENQVERLTPDDTPGWSPTG